jgi:hypothetical protein
MKIYWMRGSEPVSFTVCLQDASRQFKCPSEYTKFQTISGIQAIETKCCWQSSNGDELHVLTAGPKDFEFQPSLKLIPILT